MAKISILEHRKDSIQHSCEYSLLPVKELSPDTLPLGIGKQNQEPQKSILAVSKFACSVAF